jgi:GNAT superfamily N-acetyltransferase
MDPFDYNFAHALALFAATSKSGEVLDTQEFVLINNKLKVAAFNQAYLKRPEYKLARAIDRMIEHYARSALPFRLHLTSEDPALGAELLARGFSPLPALPCMVLSPEAELPHTAAGLAVRRVADAQTLADFQRVAFESFAYPLAGAAMALTEALIGAPHTAFFVGYVEDQPACCAGLVYTGDVAGIYWVGTLETRRKSGLGGAITAYVSEVARRRGFSRICLQATELGAPVYRRLGFRELRSYQRFDHA